MTASTNGEITLGLMNYSYHSYEYNKCFFVLLIMKIWWKLRVVKSNMYFYLDSFSDTLNYS